MLRKLSLASFLTNPSGLPIMYNSKLISKDLARRTEILINKHKSFKLSMVMDKNGRIFRVYGKIPSESTPNLYYDVCIEFDTKDPNATTLNKGVVNKVWSNSPAFLFNYTHSMYRNGMIPTVLLPKCSKEAIQNKAKIKNAYNLMGFEKSLFMLAYYISTRGYTRLSTLLSIRVSEDPIHSIKSQDVKLREYQLLHKQAVQRAKEDKKKVSKPTKIIRTKAKPSKLEAKQKRKAIKSTMDPNSKLAKTSKLSVSRSKGTSTKKKKITSTIKK